MIVHAASNVSAAWGVWAVAAAEHKSDRSGDRAEAPHLMSALICGGGSNVDGARCPTRST